MLMTENPSDRAPSMVASIGDFQGPTKSQEGEAHLLSSHPVSPSHCSRRESLIGNNMQADVALNKQQSTSSPPVGEEVVSPYHACIGDVHVSELLKGPDSRSRRRFTIQDIFGDLGEHQSVHTTRNGHIIQHFQTSSREAGSAVTGAVQQNEVDANVCSRSMEYPIQVLTRCGDLKLGERDPRTQVLKETAGPTREELTVGAYQHLMCSTAYLRT